MPRPPSVPRTAFTSASSQAAATPSPSSYAPNPVALNPGYTSAALGQQSYQQSSARLGAQTGPIAGPSRSQTGYQDPARRSSSQADALAQNLASVTISTQHHQPGPSRQPQPVTPQVRIATMDNGLSRPQTLTQMSVPCSRPAQPMPSPTLFCYNRASLPPVACSRQTTKCSSDSLRASVCVISQGSSSQLAKSFSSCG